MAKQKVTYQSLDMTGTQAAVYPTENVLWTSGPPINDPGDQGVAQSGQAPDGSGSDHDAPPGPGSSRDIAATEALIHEQLNGETPNGAYGEIWVNTQEYGPTGFGPYVGEDRFESGHTQINVSNPSSEQGWGVGPARRWAHYPIEENANPFRNRMIHCRNGALPWVTAESSLYERSQLAWEQQWDQFKQRSPVTPVVNTAASVPFVSTVPTYGGGPVPHPGVDIPTDDSLIYG